MNHIEAAILDFVAKLYPKVFSSLEEYGSRHSNFLDETILVFDREVQFYIAYLDSMARYWSAVFLLEVVKRAIFTSLREPEEILYRQHVLVDCLEHADVVREMYGIAIEAIEREKRVWSVVIGRYPEGLLHRSVEVLEILRDCSRG